MVGRADVAVLVLPSDHRFTLAEAVMTDQLLGALAQSSKSAAFTVTDRSASAAKLAGLVDATGKVQAKALADLAATLGVKRIVGLVWHGDQTISAVTLKAEGGLAEQASAEPKNPDDAKKIAALLASVLGAGGTAVAATPAVKPVVVTPTPKPMVVGPAKPVASATTVTPGQVAGSQKPPAAATTTTTTPTPSTPSATKPTAPATAEGGKTGRMEYEGAVRSFREGNYEMALTRLEKALADGASAEDVLDLRAKIYAATGDAPKRVRALQDLVNTNPARTDAVVALSLELVDQGLWQDAVRTLGKGIQATPKQAQLYLRLALIQQSQRRVNEALETLRKGMEATQDPDLALAFGQAYEAAGDLRSAQNIYSKLVASPDAKLRARALDALGDLYARSGQVDPAVEAYVEAARFRGEPAMLTGDRYKSVYGAVDRLVESHLTQAWEQFEDMNAVEGGGLPKEKVLAGLEAADAQLARALALCDEVLPPADLHQEHRQREIYYALLREAVTAAVTCVDTGRADMGDLARERWKQARIEAPGAQK
jgi:tetratricopeptide (TPR) repeat protein